MKAAKTFAGFVVALCLGMAASISYAQSVDGPFVSKQQLVSFWQAKATRDNQATYIALNGYGVYSFSNGFGPALSLDYYQCSDGLIYTNCNSIKGPISSRDKLYPTVYTMMGSSISSTTIYLDGTPIHGTPGFSPSSGSFRYKTCPAPRSYIVLDQAFTNYGDITGMNCLPQL